LKHSPCEIPPSGHEDEVGGVVIEDVASPDDDVEDDASELLGDDGLEWDLSCFRSAIGLPRPMAEDKLRCTDGSVVAKSSVTWCSELLARA